MLKKKVIFIFLIFCNFTPSAHCSIAGLIPGWQLGALKTIFPVAILLIGLGINSKSKENSKEYLISSSILFLLMAVHYGLNAKKYKEAHEKRLTEFTILTNEINNLQNDQNLDMDQKINKYNQLRHNFKNTYYKTSVKYLEKYIVSSGVSVDFDSHWWANINVHAARDAQDLQKKIQDHFVTCTESEKKQEKKLKRAYNYSLVKTVIMSVGTIAAPCIYLKLKN